MSYLDDLINISITRNTRGLTRAGFGVPLIAALHTHYVARVRRYTSLAALVADGFLTTEPAYKMAQAVFAQSPRPPAVKVGRRATAYTQVVHLTPPSAPAALGVVTVKVDTMAATFTADGTPTIAEAVTGITAAINGLADPDAIIAAGASTAGVQTLTTFDGVVGRGVMSPPRALVLELSNHANWDATTVVVTGKDPDGNTITENFAVPDGGNASVAGSKLFRNVTQVSVPAQSGTNGTFMLGTRAPVTAVATGGTHVVCTAPAGELHSYEVTAGAVDIADETADPGIEADLNAILAADGEWYGLLLDSQGAAEILAAAPWAEANRKLFASQTSDSDCLDGDEDEDVMSAVEAAGYVCTAVMFCPEVALHWRAAAWMGDRFPADPGSDTWAYKTLAGVPFYTLSDTARAVVEAKHGNHYLELLGVGSTYPGWTGAGEWIDITRGLHWLRARLGERLAGLFLGSEKVEFDDSGIDRVLSVVRAQLNEAVRVKLIAKTPPYSLTAPKVEDVDEADRAARHLPGVAFGARVAGAIHTLDLAGEVNA